MTEKTIVVTGAGSYLGGRTVARLNGYRVKALVSPRWQGGDERDGVEYIRADLEKPLPPGTIEGAHRVFHFAWSRGRNLEVVLDANRAMINHLVEPLADASKFFFISSIAGCPGAHSTYGKSKAQAAEFVRNLGASVLICGLVIDAEPRGPYKMLTSAIRKLPFRIRLTRGEPKVLPVQIDDVAGAVEALCESKVDPATYRLFGDAQGFNEFMAAIEERYPKRRIPLSMSADFILNTVAGMKRMHLAPWKLSDKILTFLYKDVDYLMTAKEIPSFTIRSFDGLR